MMHAINPAAGGAAGLSESVCLLADDQEVHQTQAPNQAQNPRIARLRRQRLVGRVHQLGPYPLFHLLTDLDRGKPVWPTVEEYAALPADFIKAVGGDKFPPAFLHVIDGRSE